MVVYFFKLLDHIQVLNIGKNSISHLTGGIFASLNGLRKLVLSDNRITGINDNAFVGLDMLEEIRSVQLPFNQVNVK